MKRKTLRIVPIDTDLGYSSSSSSSTDSMYHTSPATPQFYRVMRAHINSIQAGGHGFGSPHSYSGNEYDTYDSARSTGTTESGYDRRIKCQNKCTKCCCFAGILALFCGTIAAA